MSNVCGKTCDMNRTSLRSGFRVLILSLCLVLPAASQAQNAAPRSLPAATENAIRALLASPSFRDAHIGIYIKALGTASSPAAFPSQPYADKSEPLLFQVDADKRFLPASNMKLYTAAIALQTLGAERRFTTIAARVSTRPNAIYLVGNGDPSLTVADLKQLARDVRKSGVTRVDGVYADHTAFVADTFGGRYPDGWTLDDALWYYGPEVSALALERNQVDVTITGTQAGKAAKVSVSPQLPGFALGQEIAVNVQTTASGQGSVQFERSDATNPIGTKLLVRGQIAPGKTVTEGVAIPNVARVAALTFARELRAQGVTVSGTVGVEKSGFQGHKMPSLARHSSQPLRVLVQRFLKKSDNLYGEMLLRSSAEMWPRGTVLLPGSNTANESVSTGVSSTGAAAQGHMLLMRWLRSVNVPAESLRFSDGSGLSRYNLATPRATTELLRAVEGMNGARAFWEALPIAGVDGTLAGRMKGTPAANNVRAKTGTFSIASCLSGYVTTRDGHRLAGFCYDQLCEQRWRSAALAERFVLVVGIGKLVSEYGSLHEP
jgi:D-alanyl-D-alanine carboxypeptidase/D-alanyl-D-alanine-endopeptidase (penicillin-binding protein 4)